MIWSQKKAITASNLTVECPVQRAQIQQVRGQLPMRPPTDSQSSIQGLLCPMAKGTGHLGDAKALQAFMTI